MFATRDLLKYGTRGAVDQCLHQMVKRGFIKRLARGVFIRDDSENPSIEEIAHTKAAAFGRKIFEHPADVLKGLKILRAEGLDDRTFAISGHTSRFMTVHGPVHMRGVAPRKAILSDTKAGQRVHALWHFGDNHFTSRAAYIAFRNFQRKEKEDLRSTSSLMPAWLRYSCLLTNGRRSVR
jgi:hypothetical protein